MGDSMGGSGSAPVAAAASTVPLSTPRGGSAVTVGSSKLRAALALRQAAEESAKQADAVSGRHQHKGKFVNAHQARQAKIEAARKKREEKEKLSAADAGARKAPGGK